MRSFLDSPWFDYSVTRPITLHHFNATFLVIGALYSILSTLASVIGSGYENVPVISTSFNISVPLWYDRFLPTSAASAVLPGGAFCNPTTIRINEGSSNARFYLM
jgi:hypothetical protein